MLGDSISDLQLLRRCSAALPVVTRLHIFGRYLTCPFAAVVAALPSEADVLDIGAGHGVFARLAIERGARRVVALEPDLRKIPHRLQHPAVVWVAGFDDAVKGRFDAAVLCDVLYRVPLPERNALLARLFERLRPGGTLLIKELDPGRRIKFRWNVFQETIADRLRLTLGSALAYESREAFGRRLAHAGFIDSVALRIDRGYPHPHVLYRARRPPDSIERRQAV